MLANLTRPQAAYYLHHLPTVEARRHYSTSALIAALKNIAGGKPDPNDKDAKVVDPERVYYPDEELPFFAYFGDSVGRGLTVRAAVDLVTNLAWLPAWAREIAPLADAQRVATG